MAALNPIRQNNLARRLSNSSQLQELVYLDPKTQLDDYGYHYVILINEE